jgi:branched-chain amino acid transport system substrate-binding protein
MYRFQKGAFVLVVLGMFLLYGCSDDENANAPERESESVNVSVAGLPRPGSVPGEQEKAEVEEQERALRIGVIGPETGKEAPYGLSVLKGVLAAAGRFNSRGGLDGSEIEVLHYDNKSDPELTREGVQKLIRQGVIAILSAPTGWATFVPTHIANSTRTIFISVGTRRRIGRSGPYVFRASLPDELATAELIRYAVKELAYTNYAMVTSSSYDYSLALSAVFKRALVKHGGVLSVEADTYDTYSGKQDMDAVIDAISGSDSTLHGVIFTGPLQEAIVLARGLRNAGSNLPILGGEDLFAAEYLNGGAAVRGTLLFATFSPDNESPKVVEFKHDYGEGEPDRFSALAYDTFMLLAQAIKTAGTTNTSKVREALVSVKDFEGATGKTSFTSSGTPVKRPFIYSVKEGEQGERFVLSKQQ